MKNRVWETARRVATLLEDAGASRCLLVGGYVRDQLLGIDSKDLDIEVYGLSYDEIKAALSPHFPVNLVGADFGIAKIGPHLDVSIPRRERKKGRGHRGFEVTPDPEMDFAEAAARRDFTINSMGMDFEGRILDPFGGEADLRRKILRATSSAFSEDPLRVLRGMQFAARFDLAMAPDTVSMCRNIANEFATLSRERLWGEWAKWTGGDFPGQGLAILLESEWLKHFPVLAAMVGVPQQAEWHPEGDVWTHTGHVVAAAAQFCRDNEIAAEDRQVLMFSALLHDCGKPATTVRDRQGRWVSPDHAGVGRQLARDFFYQVMAPHGIVERVLPLVAEHMAHLSISRRKSPSPRVVRRLAARLAPATIREWRLLVRADYAGRPPLPPADPAAVWQQLAEELCLADSQPHPILRGRDLMEMGIPAGPQMGQLLNLAFEAQLDGKFEDKEGALKWLKKQEPLGRE